LLGFPEGEMKRRDLKTIGDTLSSTSFTDNVPEPVEHVRILKSRRRSDLDVTLLARSNRDRRRRVSELWWLKWKPRMKPQEANPRSKSPKTVLILLQVESLYPSRKSSQTPKALHTNGVKSKSIHCVRTTLSADADNLETNRFATEHTQKSISMGRRQQVKNPILIKPKRSMGQL
jgi:hypothetical protein